MAKTVLDIKPDGLYFHVDRRHIERYNRMDRKWCEPYGSVHDRQYQPGTDGIRQFADLRVKTMGQQMEKLHVTHWIVAVSTCIIVAISVYTCHIATVQLGLQSWLKAIELRPYLVIEHRDMEITEEKSTDYEVTFGFCDSSKKWRDRDNWIQCDSVRLDTLTDSDRFCFCFDRGLLFTNIGATPMRLTRFVASTLSQFVWETQFKSSADSLLEFLLDDESWWKELPFDITLRQGDTSRVYKCREAHGSILWSELEPLLKNNESLRFYPYSIGSYVDEMGSDLNLSYSTLYMEEVTFPISIQGGWLKIDDAKDRKVQIFRFPAPVEKP